MHPEFTCKQLKHIKSFSTALEIINQRRYPVTQTWNQ